jgi:hypothetical protein
MAAVGGGGLHEKERPHGLPMRQVTSPRHRRNACRAFHAGRHGFIKRVEIAGRTIYLADGGPLRGDNGPATGAREAAAADVPQLLTSLAPSGKGVAGEARLDPAKGCPSAPLSRMGYGS